MNNNKEITDLFNEYLNCSDEIDNILSGKSDGDLVELEKKLKSLFIDLSFKTKKKKK